MRSKRLIAVLVVAVLVITMVSGATIAMAAGKGRGVKPVKPDKQNVQPLNDETTSPVKNRNKEQIVNRILERRNAFLVKGKALDMTSTQITVEIQLATGMLKDMKGETVTIALTPETTIYGLGELGFEPGIYVIVYGFASDGYTASKVVFLPYRWVVLNGQVTSVSEGSFTMMVKTTNRIIKDLRGTEVEILVSDETVFSSPTSRPVELKPGMFVNVFGYTRGGSIHAKKVIIKAKPYDETTAVVEPGETTPTTEVANGDTDTTPTTPTPDTTITSGTTETTTGPVFSMERAKRAFKSIVDEIRDAYRNLFGFLKRLFWKFW